MSIVGTKPAKCRSRPPAGGDARIARIDAAANRWPNQRADSRQSSPIPLNPLPSALGCFLIGDAGLSLIFILLQAFSFFAIAAAGKNQSVV